MSRPSLHLLGGGPPSRARLGSPRPGRRLDPPDGSAPAPVPAEAPALTFGRLVAQDIGRHVAREIVNELRGQLQSELEQARLKTVRILTVTKPDLERLQRGEGVLVDAAGHRIDLPAEALAELLADRPALGRTAPDLRGVLAGEVRAQAAAATEPLTAALAPLQHALDAVTTLQRLGAPGSRP